MRFRLGRATTQQCAISFAVLLAFLGFTIDPAQAQVGVTLCACSPAVYTFELIFDGLCEDTNVEGLGIENSNCFTAPAGIEQNIEDFRPVAVTGVDILELDQTLVPFTFQPIRGSFRDGNIFTYTSITATDPNLPLERIPGGFQMNIVGVNELDQDIQNVWIITFTNECGVFPIFSIGEQIGWTKLVNITLPENQYCPGKVFLSGNFTLCHCSSQSNNEICNFQVNRQARRQTPHPLHHQ